MAGPIRHTRSHMAQTETLQEYFHRSLGHIGPDQLASSFHQFYGIPKLDGNVFKYIDFISFIESKKKRAPIPVLKKGITKPWN